MNKKIVTTILLCLAICFVCAFSGCSATQSMSNGDVSNIDAAISQPSETATIEDETQTVIQNDTQEETSSSDTFEAEIETESTKEDIIIEDVEAQEIALGDVETVNFDGVNIKLENIGSGYSIVGVEGNPTSIKIASSGYNIVEIADRVFRGLTNLTSLEITCNTITSIGTYAFYNTPNLTDVSLPSSITEFGELCFYGSKYLNIARGTDPNKLLIINNVIVDGRAAKGDLTIPSNVTSIAPKAFHYATELTSVSFAGSGVTRIPYQAFYGCNKLTSVNLSGVKDIADYAFTSCTALESISGISVSLATIGAGAFKNDASLTTLDFSASNVTFTIGESAFANCTGLTKVIFPLGIKSIEKNAFYKCTKLAELEFNSATTGFTKIGTCAFSGDYSLKTIVNQGVMPTPELNAFEETQIVL